MKTKLAERKSQPFTAATSTQYRGRILHIKLTPHECIIWEHRMRTKFKVPWPVVLEAGMNIAAAEAWRKKMANKKEKKT